MDDAGNLTKKAGTANQPKLADTVQGAQAELDRFLHAHPELKAFQEEIDRRLRNAGDTANRLAVLSIMIEGKLKDLQDHMSHFLSQKK